MIVSVGGLPRPGVVVQVDGDRSLVRYRDAGDFSTTWVDTAGLIAVEPRRPRPPLLRLVGLTVVGVLGLALLLRPGGSDRRLADLQPTAAPTATPAPASPTPLPGALPSGRPGTSVTVAPVRAVLLGDSLTAGRGNPAGTATALQVAARRLRWRATVLAAPGSGFTAGGAQAFGPRLAREVTVAPDVLVLQGGSSDTAVTAEQLTRAVTAVVDQVQRRFPRTRIVLVGPVAMEQPPDGQLVRVDRVLGAVARAQRVAYVDPIRAGWVTADNAPGYTATTGYYPNRAGHAYLGARLATALSS